ncbi:competence protein ComK [Psychrobacillus sp.]|uniref:competence protein ComK n=1 Tax=Psychrobacillus sp. TaxID=1871623 RepID=UPI0028BE2626|nr:competence protein ComK [Psychrobacillus sp.]
MSIQTEDKFFIISFETAVLQPIQMNNKTFTKVTKFSGESLVIGKKPYDIVRQSCSYYGSSFQQSVKLSREAIGKYHKLPAVIAHDYGNPCILIPTLSPKSDLNVWFSLKAIQSFHPSKDGCSIILTNGQTLDVNSSTTTISRQIGFANILNMHFLKRMNRLSNEAFLTTRNQFLQKDSYD